MDGAQVGGVQGQVRPELAGDDVVDGAGSGVAAEVADVGCGQDAGPYSAPWSPGGAASDGWHGSPMSQPGKGEQDRGGTCARVPAHAHHPSSRVGGHPDYRHVVECGPRSDHAAAVG
jgi:hypothetical protein